MSVFPFSFGDTGATITDSVARFATRVRTTGDTGVTSVDSIVRNAGTRNRVIADTGSSVSESIVRVHRYQRFLSDTGATVSGSIATHAVQPFRVAVDQGAAVNDALNSFTTGRVGPDTYADGPSLVFGPALSSPYVLSIFADVVPIFVPASAEREVYFARLPFREAQTKFSETVPVPGARLNVNCSWHGLITDPERGSFALARAGGPLEPLIGRRVKVTKRGSSGRVFVVAYLHGIADIDDRDGITLTRRLFLALTALGDDRLPVTVEPLQ